MLTATLLFAALLGTGRLFVAEREQGGFDAFLLAPVDRTALLWPKRPRCSCSLAFSKLAVPAFGLFLPAPRLDGASRPDPRAALADSHWR